MSAVFVDVSMSLDGFIAGPNDSRENPLGDGGELPRAPRPGGRRDRPDDEIVAEWFENVGVYVMGRRMFGNDEGLWGDHPFEG